MGAAVELPVESPVDAAFDWRVTGAPADAPVTVKVEATMSGSRWRSEATFVTTSDGALNAEEQAPVSGSYSGVDAAGLLWSMVHVSGPVDFPFRTVDPVEAELSVTTDGRELVRGGFRRLVLDPGVERRPVADDGLLGTFFAPVGGRHPAVLVLGGSEGGLSEGYAAVLARHGFATLALAYFAAPGLPPRLMDIPVEYFRSALDWLGSQPETAPGRPAVVGSSKGGEAALLVASTYDDVGAAIGVVPSGVAFMGIGRSPLAQRHSSWTRGGRPVPFVPSRYSWRTMREFASRKPIHLRVFYEEAMANERAMTEATFPLERVAGPVLLVSGQDDQLWPSAELAARAAAHLSRRHGLPVENVVYPDCGHAVTLPNTPAFTAIPRAFAGRTLVLGGTREGCVAAARDGWPRALAFLRRSLALGA